MAGWPGGARGALSLSFDNLGEASELELGATVVDANLGRHPTATRVLPSLLDVLGERGFAATFFVEGLNAELYPEALARIAAAGHEVGYHAWRHEQWTNRTAAEQAENLVRGRRAFGELDIEVTGFRPPGGQLGAGGLGVLREAGLRYCSPAGEGVGVEDGVAVLPFQWRHVDATSLLPGLDPVREQIAGSPDPIEPQAFAEHLRAEIDRLVGEGGYMAIVLHLSLLDWLGWDRLRTLIDQLAATARHDDVWVARCTDVAEHVLAHTEAFQGAAQLDPTGWASAA